MYIENDLWVSEFNDIMLVLEMGAKKHGATNWLRSEGSKASSKDMHASMFRHLAESSAGIKADPESGLHPLLHLATRALMQYTREKRGITHSSDAQKQIKELDAWIEVTKLGINSNYNQDGTDGNATS